MTAPRADEPRERDERDDDEHPLESPDALRHPREVADEEQDRVPQPAVTPDVADR